jgi:hypothetical protein
MALEQKAATNFRLKAELRTLSKESDERHSSLLFGVRQIV